MNRPPSLLALPTYLASQVSILGRRQLEQAMAAEGLGLQHHALLTALHDFGPLSQQQLSRSLEIDKSHLVRPIDLLEERGLAVRERDREDRRRHRVTLTAAGRDLLERMRIAETASQRQFLSALSPPERETLVCLLRRILEAEDTAR